MNLLSILGSLPASGSTKGKLNGIDLMKIMRMGIMIGAGYCLTAIVEALIRDVSNGAMGIPMELQTPMTGVLTMALEMVRRKFATPAQ